MTRKANAALVFLVLASATHAANDPGFHTYTDKEANDVARRTLALAERLWEEGNELCHFGIGDERFMQDIKEQARSASMVFVTAVPGRDALRPYMFCAAAIGAVRGQMHNCLSKYSRQAEKIYTDELKRSALHCRREIANPDLSLAHP